MRVFRGVFWSFFVLFLAISASAQSERELEQTCRVEVGRRLNLSRDGIKADMSGWSDNRARVQWRSNDRSGYCVIDRRMNVVDFKDSGRGGDERDDHRRDDDWDNDGSRWHSISEYPRLAVDTDGRGPLKVDNQTLRIRRGYVNTRETPSVALRCDRNYRVTFRGDVVQANGDREFVIRITGSDRGDARGMATIRLNPDRNEVEFINVRGRLNGRPFEGTFDRN